MDVTGAEDGIVHADAVDGEQHARGAHPTYHRGAAAALTLLNEDIWVNAEDIGRICLVLLVHAFGIDGTHFLGRTLVILFDSIRVNHDLLDVKDALLEVNVVFKGAQF